MVPEVFHFEAYLLDHIDFPKTIRSIKHGLLENHPFMDKNFPLKPPYIGNHVGILAGNSDL